MRPLPVVLLLVLVGCDDRSSPTGAPSTPMNAATAPAGMNKYPYLAADGGPHMLLPSGAAGVDYSRACALTANAQMALMPIGSVSAMILADPPMTAWGTSADGWVEVYYLKSWTGMNLDALVAKASAALPTSSMTDSGQVFRLAQADAFLLFAGDTPTSSAYGVHRVTIPAGTYTILTGTFSAAGESVTIYRLKPAGT
ncbi:MAG TPA: hypothetical protein VEA69_11275 [Tepidisphaeraceae bacterium]|nr:hypothetical protein [Tepidisphaeraceae bacterium]